MNRGACCHVAGDIAFDSKNNLWLVTGDDTPAGGGNSGGFSPHNDGPTNEIQTVTTANATGGTFTLTFNRQTTAPITFTPGNAAANNAAVEAALEALDNLDDVTVTGNNQNVRTVDFRQQDVPEMTADGSGLTGTTPTVTVATTQPGGLLNAPFVDARRSALNTNDLRGKILRIKVNEDGSYSVPKGNLFDEREDKADKTRPEIYAMGFRNPFRINLDEDDNAYITDYSPDSRVPQVFRGPAGTGRVDDRARSRRTTAGRSATRPTCRTTAGTSSRRLRSTILRARTFAAATAGTVRRTPRGWNTGLTETPPVTQPEIWYSFNDNNTPPAPPLTAPLGTPCFDVLQRAYRSGDRARHDARSSSPSSDRVAASARTEPRRYRLRPQD